MKLNHIIEAYRFNNIEVELYKKDIESSKVLNIPEEAGVLKFNDDIYAAFILDDEKFICGINLFANAVVNKDLNIQIKHTEKLLVIVQKTIELLCDTTQEEANNILDRLGILKGILKEKAVERMGCIYKIKADNGIFNFMIMKTKKEIPPVKSQKANENMGSGVGAFTKPISL